MVHRRIFPIQKSKMQKNKNFFEKRLDKLIYMMYNGITLA